MDVKMEPSWKTRLAGEFEKDYFVKLTDFVRQEYRQATVYPSGPNIFNAFAHCPFDRVKVVIIGQDPYHEPGQAHGLCFSVQDGTPFPPSLQNIFKEITDDLGRPRPTSGDLTRWADQGVLLLNATLTVRAHRAGSHQGRGWETFTDAAIRCLNAERQHLAPPFAAVGPSRLLWQPPFQSRQRLFSSPRRVTHRLVSNRGESGTRMASLAVCIEALRLASEMLESLILGLEGFRAWCLVGWKHSYR